MRGLASTSIFASTQLPAPSTASRSSSGESCLHGQHHSAQKSMMTGVVSDRSSTSVWNVASVTSMTAAPPGAPPAGPAGDAGATGFAGATGLAGAAAAGGGAVARSRSALRSTAPRMIDGVLRGSIVVKFCTSPPEPVADAAPPTTPIRVDHEVGRP
jgi:hypothetical protein